MSPRVFGPILLVTLASGLLLITGCGRGDKIERRAISGTVRLNGKAIADGMVVFAPLGKGPSASAKIKDGEFKIDRDSGPSPGKHRVEITASRDSGKSYQDPASGHSVPLIESLIPPQYNSDSKLQAEVTDTGKNQFEFDLQYQPQYPYQRR